MANWRKIIAAVAHDMEGHFDALKQKLGERLGGDDPLMILPYRTYGTPQKLLVKGRVLENEGIRPAEENDTTWENLLNMYKRFASDEIPGARVLVRFQGQVQEVVANEEGFFELWLKPAQPLPAGQLWPSATLELLEPQREGQEPVTATAEVVVPPSTARFGIISDVDDTVLRTSATNLLMMARTVFLANARTRLPFEGVAAFYRALHQGASQPAYNPLFYVSSSPWNLYDLLVDFFRLQNIPRGPILLRDWGLAEEELLPVRHRAYKLGAIRQVLDTYPHLPFILIGDSGQEDTDIYRELVDLYPSRILAIFIRNVSHKDPKRVTAIEALVEQVKAAGSTLMLARTTVPMAEYAAQKGWISPDALPEIRTEKEADEASPGPVEKMLHEEAAGPKETVVVHGDRSPEAAVEAGQAVETALETAEAGDEQPPTIVVEGDEERTLE